MATRGFHRSGIEGFVEKKLTLEETLTPAEEAVYAKLVAPPNTNTLSSFQAARPRMDDFADTYSPEKLQNAKEHLESAKEDSELRIVKQPTTRSAIWEALVYNEINKSDWLGNNAVAVRASEYDDWINHTDLVVEWWEGDNKIQRDEEGNPMRLAIDTSVSGDVERILKKAELIRKEIERGNFTTISFYDSETHHGTLHGVPRTVLPISPYALGQYCGVWNASKPRERATHPMQMFLLNWMAQFLETQQRLAEQKYGRIAAKNQFGALYSIAALLREEFEYKNALGSARERESTKEFVERLEKPFDKLLTQLN